jgi:hypothetical protein
MAEKVKFVGIKLSAKGGALLSEANGSHNDYPSAKRFRRIIDAGK